jgi:hypothetical protein
MTPSCHSEEVAAATDEVRFQDSGARPSESCAARAAERGDGLPISS